MSDKFLSDVLNLIPEEKRQEFLTRKNEADHTPIDAAAFNNAYDIVVVDFGIAQQMPFDRFILTTWRDKLPEINADLMNLISLVSQSRQSSQDDLLGSSLGSASARKLDLQVIAKSS